MPIRFRCVYCEQLLGIARRKANTVVRCPGCGGQLVVPEPNASNSTEDAPGSPEPAAGGPALFERDDIDDLLRQKAPVQSISTRHSPVPPAVSTEGTVSSLEGPAVVPQPQPRPAMAPATPQTGIVLSPMTATILSVVIVLAVSLAFAAGLFTGLALRQVAGGP